MCNWIEVAPLQDIQRLGSRVVRSQDEAGEIVEIAVFRLSDDRVFAVNNRCPHKGGPLSEGIVYGDKVACPLHSWKISLADGRAEEPDVGQTACFKTKVEAGLVYLALKDKTA